MVSELFVPLRLSSLPKRYVREFSLSPGVSANPLAVDDLILLAIDYRKVFRSPLPVKSGYRSVAEQAALKKRMSRSGKGAFAAKAGYSEHALGTAFDIGNARSYAWLAENAWKHGFVMTYGPGCGKITGFPEEKWHYRWIGTEAAKEYRDSGKACPSDFLGK